MAEGTSQNERPQTTEGAGPLRQDLYVRSVAVLGRLLLLVVPAVILLVCCGRWVGGALTVFMLLLLLAIRPEGRSKSPTVRFGGQVVRGLALTLAMVTGLALLALLIISWAFGPMLVSG